MTATRNIWEPEDPGRMAISPRNLIVVAFLVGVGFVVATLGSFSVPVGKGVSSFWPAMVIQCLGGIWFGGWGVIAGVVFPIFSNLMIGGPWLGFIPSNILQSLVPAWYFRRLRVDPSLSSTRDYLGFILVASVLSNVCGAGVGNLILYAQGQIEGAQFWYGFLNWVPGNAIPCIVFGIPLLKVLSPIVTQSNLFCKTMWRSEIRPHRRMRSFADLPILIKLLIGFALAGIVPIMVIAVMTIQDQSRSVKNRMNQAILGDAKLLAAELEQYVSGCASVLQNTADALGELVADDAVKAIYLKRLGMGAGGLREARLVNQTEALAVETLWPLSRRPFSFAPKVSVYAKGSEEGHDICLAARPDAPGAPYLLAKLDLAPIRSFVSRCEERDPNLQVEIVGAEGCARDGEERFARTAKAGAAALVHSAEQDAKRMPPGAGPNSYPEEWRNSQGVEQSESGLLIAHAPCDTLRYTVFVSKNMEEAFEETLVSQRSALSFLVTLGIFAALIVGGFIAHHIERPIESLTESVHRFGKGEFDARIHISSEDEIGQLARAFEQMSQDLKRHVEELKAATATKERLETELKVAARLQESLLPQSDPKVQGFDIHGASVPAREVGGDYYGYIEFDDGNIGIGIGDASGKGMLAAMFMAECRAVTMALAIQTRDLVRMYQLSNRMLAHDAGSTGMFASFFASVIHPAERTLTYSCAGHNPTYLIRPGEPPRPLKVGGPVLGIIEEAAYRVETVPLRSGDLLLYYTDGVTEAHNTNLELFGDERLLGLSERMLSAGSASAAVDLITSAVTEFAAAAPQHDDMTVVIVRVL